MLCSICYYVLSITCLEFFEIPWWVVLSFPIDADKMHVYHYRHISTPFHWLFRFLQCFFFRNGAKLGYSNKNLVVWTNDITIPWFWVVKYFSVYFSVYDTMTHTDSKFKETPLPWSLCFCVWGSNDTQIKFVRKCSSNFCVLGVLMADCNFKPHRGVEDLP